MVPYMVTHTLCTPAWRSITPCRSYHTQYDMVAQIKPTQRWRRLLTAFGMHAFRTVNPSSKQQWQQDLVGSQQTSDMQQEQAHAHR